MKKKLIIIFLLLLTLLISTSIVIVVYINFISPKQNDLSEIEMNIINKELEYISESGFGNDSFIIYSYSLNNIENLKSFKKLDENYTMKSLKSSIYNSSLIGKDDIKNKIYTELNLLESKEDSIYL